MQKKTCYQSKVPAHPTLKRTVSKQVVFNDQNIRKFFPQAMRTEDVGDGVKVICSKMGLNATNTLFGHSVCPDEINH